MTLERVLDAIGEGRDDRLANGLEAVLEIKRAEAGLDERGDDVAVAREARELVGVSSPRQLGQPVAETEAATDDRAALARDDMGPDLGETTLPLVGEAVIELLGDRQPENAVSEELEALVRLRALLRPGCVRERVPKAFLGQALDQLEER
jgi:hypothetical protein